MEMKFSIKETLKAFNASCDFSYCSICPHAGDCDTSKITSFLVKKRKKIKLISKEIEEKIERVKALEVEKNTLIVEFNCACEFIELNGVEINE